MNFNSDQAGQKRSFKHRLPLLYRTLHFKRLSQKLLFFSLVLLLFQFAAGPAGAQLTVTTTNDTGAGSLRTAISNASGDPLTNNDTINFSLSNLTFSPATSYQTVTKSNVGSLSIIGTNITISGGSLGGSPAFNFLGWSVFTLSGLTLANATASIGSGTTLAGNLGLNSGTLSLSSGSTVSATLNLIGSGGIFNVAGGTSEMTGVIAGTGALAVSGSGILDLTNLIVNNSTGDTSIGSGSTLRVNDDAQLGSNANSNVIFNGGTLDTTSGIISGRNFTFTSNGGTINVDSGTTSLTGSLFGSGLFSVTGNGIVDLTGLAANNSIGDTSIGLGSTLRVSDDSQLGANTTGNVALNGGTLDTTTGIISSRNFTFSPNGGTINVNSGTTSLTGSLFGSGLFSVTGNGIVDLTGLAANNSTGDTSIGLGSTLRVSDDSQLGANTNGNVFFNGGTLQFTESVVSTRNLNLLSGGGTIDVLSGQMVDLASITGTGSLTKTDSGVLGIDGNNNYSGGTFLNGGTLNLGNNSALGTGALAMENGTLQAGLNGLSVSNNVALNSSETYDSNGNSSTLSGVISGSGNLTVVDSQGGGVLTLSGNNTYTGGTDIEAATLVLGNNNALGTGDLDMGDLSTLRAGVNGLAVTNNIWTAGTNTFDSNGNSWTLSGVVGGIANVVVADSMGGGLLTLSGNNTYSGGTNLAGGTLRLGNNNALGTGDLEIGDGTTLQAGANHLSIANNVFMYGFDTIDNNGNNWTLSGVIGGTGTLNSIDNMGGGAGSLTITGNNTYSGGTELEGTGLWVGNSNALGTGAVTLDGGVFLAAAVSGLAIPNAVVLTDTNDFSTNGYNTTLSGVMSGVGGLEKLGNGTLTLTGTNTFTEGIDLQAGGLGLGNNSALGTGGLTMENGTTLQAALNGVAVSNSVTLMGLETYDTNGVKSTLAGLISGTGSMAVTDTVGGGAVTFSDSSNSYSGGTDLNGGSLVISNNGDLGNTSAGVTFDGGTLETTANLTSARAVSLASLGGTVDVAGSSSTTLTGVVSGTGSLTKTDLGTLYLDAADTYSGGTTLNGGALGVTTATGLGSGRLTMNSGTTFILGGSFSTLNVANAVSLNGNDTINSPNGSTPELNGVISGTGSLTTSINGNLLLGNANTYSGGTTVKSGMLLAGATNAFGTGALSISAGATVATEAGGTLGLANNFILNGADTFENGYGTAPNLNLTGIISGTGSLYITGSSGSINIRGVNTYSGGTTVEGTTLTVYTNAALGTGQVLFAGGQDGLYGGIGGVSIGNALKLNGANLTIETSGPMTLGGVVSNFGTLQVFGTLALMGANTYSGGTTLNGTLTLGNNTALGANGLTLSGSSTLKSGVNGLNLSSSSGVTLGSNTLTYDMNGENSTLSGVISGTGNLAVTNSTGSGALTLTGTNTYSGSTSINGGTLVIGSNANLGNTSGGVIFDGGTLETTAGFSSARGVNLASLGGTVDVTGSNSTTLTGVISGTGSLTKTDTGTLILSGANTYSGGTNLSGGTLSLGNNSALGTSAVTMQTGTTLSAGLSGLSVSNNFLLNGNETYSSGANNSTLSGVISGTGSLTKTGSGALTMTGSNTYAGGTTLTTGTLNLGNNNALGTGSLSMGTGTTLQAGLNGLAAANNVTLNGTDTFDTNGDSSTLSGVISGSGSLTQTGAGTLNLDGNNTYGGGTNLNGGTLGLGNNNALGTGSLTMANGTTLQAGVDGLVVGNNVTLTGNDTIDSQTYNLTLSGVLSGAGSLTKINSGALTLTGDNTYSGGTTIDGGNVVVTNAGALGTGGFTLNGGSLLGESGALSSTTLTLGSTTTLDVNPGDNDTLGALSGSGTVDIQSGSLTTGGDDSSTLFSGVITGPGSLDKTGTGTMTLTGDNTFTGGTDLQQGTLNLGNNNALGTGSLALEDGTTLQAGLNGLNVVNSVTLNGSDTYDSNGNNSTLSGVISGTGSLDKTGTGTLALTGNNTYTGGTTLSDGTLNLGNNNALGTGNLTLEDGTTLQAGMNGLAVTNTVTLNGTDTYDSNGNGSTLSGVISGTGSLAVTDTVGGGALTLTGNNTYTGGTDLQGGTLNLGNNNALGTGNLSLESGSTLQAGINNLAVTNAVSLNGADTYDSNGNDSTLSGVISGTGSLDKTGTGTLTLTGDNTYSGGTTLADGTLNLGSNNALGTGNLDIEDGTTLQAGLNGLAVTNGLTLNGSDTYDSNGNGSTLSGVIGGTGSLVVTDTVGGGALTLTGDNTYMNGTDLQGGTLNLGNNNALGTGNLALENGTTLQAGLNGLSVANNVILSGADTYDSNGNNSTLSGVISGTGSLDKTGAGTLTLTGDNTYSGGTTLAEGTLNLGDNNALGTGSLALEDGTILQAGINGLAVTNRVSLNGNDTYDSNGNGSALSGVISGTGSLAVTDTVGGGALTLTGNNTYTGGTDLQGGTLNLGNNNALGTGSLALEDGTTLQAGINGLAVTNTISLNGTDTYDSNGNGSALSGVISGAGSLAVTDTVGGGALTLTGNNTYTGGTDLQGGTLNLGNNNALGTGNLTLEDGTTLQAGINGLAVTNTISLNGTDTYDSNGNNSTLSGVIGGTGSLTQTGTGTLNLTGNNTYSGGTNLNGGTLNLGSDNALGTGGLAMADGTTLQAGLNGLAVSNNVALTGGDTYDTNGNGSTLSGVISGAGSLAVTNSTGSGSLTVTGDNTYTGGTSINSGTLVAANANALGTGDVVNHSTLSLAGPMTLTIGGGYTQNAAGTLLIGLGSTASLYDSLNVAGTASLAGTLKLFPYGGFQIHDNEDFTIITAGSVTGKFTTVTDTVGGDAVSVVYNPTDVVVEALANAPSFATLGTTTNQKQIGSALDGLAKNSQDPALINYLNSQSNAALPGIYNQLSPSSLTPLYQIGFTTAQAQAGMIGQRLSQLFGNFDSTSSRVSWTGEGPQFAGNMPAWEEVSMGPNLPPQRWGAFANGIGNFGTVSGDSNSAGYQYSTGGTTAGLDYRFSKNFVGGLLLGYTQSGTSQSIGTVNATGGQAGLYAGWKQNALHIEALAEGGLNTYTTQRNAAGGTAVGSTQGQQYSGQLSAGVDLMVDQTKVMPFLSGQYTRMYMNGFTETGSFAPETFGAQNEGYLSTDLGATASHSWNLGGIQLSPSVSAAWEHVYQGNTDSLTASFGTGSSFTVNGPSTGTDAAVLGAGLNAQFTRGFNLFAQYQGKVGLTNYTEQNVSAGVNIGF